MSDEHITFGTRPEHPWPWATGSVLPAHVDPTVALHERMVVVDGEDVVDTWAVDLGDGELGAAWPRARSPPSRPRSREVDITSPGKVFFPQRGETKLDLVRYYLAVEGPAMAAMGGRPVLMQRFRQLLPEAGA